ncbi:MAG: hypothetical protein E6160_09530, partial [Bifidobacterium bifidum]|nr:hypothetical protein [Bifidobacterium bifidum]
SNDRPVPNWTKTYRFFGRKTHATLAYNNLTKHSGDEDEPEVGEEGLVEPVVAGGGLAVALRAVEDGLATVCWTGS